MKFDVSSAEEEIPVKIRAEDLRFIENTTLVEATGSVEVTIKGTTITADRLLIDSETNLAIAEGNVLIVNREYQASAGQLTYNASDESAIFNDFSATVFPAGIKGAVDVRSRSMSDSQGAMVGQDSEANTCGNELPHYHVRAQKIEIYPDGKLAAHNITLYIGQLPVFWLPYYVREDKKQDRRNWVFGHNEVEGDFFKSTWDYPLGLLYLDEMQKKGYGVGTLTGYTLLGLGAGSLYLYTQPERDTSITNWVTKIDHTKQIDPTTVFKLEQRYASMYLIPSGRTDQTTLNLSLKHAAADKWQIGLSALDNRLGNLAKYAAALSRSEGKVSTDYNFDYDFAKTSPYWLRASQRLTDRRTLWSDNVMLLTRLNYNNYVTDEGVVGDERLEPFVEITGREKDFTWRMTSNWYLDLDGDRFVGDNTYQHTDKMPEIGLTPKALNLFGVTLSPDLTYGHYREVKYVAALGRNRDFEADRTKVTLNASKALPVGFGTTATLGLGLDQLFYSPGDQLYTYRESLALNTRLSSFFRNEINYKKSISDGNSPFLFDTLGSRYHSVTEKMTFYHLDKFNWTIEGGHNWQTHKWLDVMTGLLVSPTKQVRWNLRTGWDIENTQYKDLVNSLRLLPYSFLGFEFASTSDLNTGQVKSGSLLYDLYLLEGEPNQWRFKVSQVYEPASGQFKVRDIMVIKQLHCWELQYAYNDFRKEYSFMLSLKALPNEPIGLSTGRGFYVEGLEKEINKSMQEIKSEGAIKRY